MSQEILPVESGDAIVFVIDDDPSVRKSLSRLLTSMGFRNEVFGSAEDFLARGLHPGIGCIVLDIRMPGLTGMDLQDELATIGSSLPIIFITGHGNIPMGVTAMKKGAMDFLLKPFDDGQLLKAVTDAIGKHRDICMLQKEKGDVLQRLALLSPREYQIFRCILTGMPNKQIGYSLAITEKTVKVHRGRVMEKLKVSSVADLVRLAQKAGIEPSETG